MFQSSLEHWNCLWTRERITEVGLFLQIDTIFQQSLVQWKVLENGELIFDSNFFSLSSKSGFYFRRLLGYEINAPKIVGHENCCLIEELITKADLLLHVNSVSGVVLVQ
jgi:hypothetical protein